ncbi:MAG: septum formation initiator family protein [Chloroflexota bacterium]|nr:septum formation initiator family protein [Chloroflexota bacterium]
MPAVLTIALVAIAVAAVLPLLQSSQATTISDNVRQLERARNDWQARTHELEAEIATLGSLDHIEKEARERLGMVPPTDTIYLIVDVPSPPEQFVPLRFLPPKQKKAEKAQSWWESLLDQLPLP